MFNSKSKSFRQILLKLTAIILVVLLLVSCGKSVPSGDNNQGDDGDQGVTILPVDDQEGGSEQQDDDSNPSYEITNGALSYGAFMEVKGEVVNMLTEDLTNNSDTVMDAISLLDVVLLDIALLPASSFGLGQEAANMTLGILGLQDVVYSENGTQYSVRYKGADGEQCELQGVYDKAADALKCTALTDEKKTLVYEYRRTPFGYVAQAHAFDDEGTIYVYKMAFSGKNGVIGKEQGSSEPSALSGNEALDFPKKCPEWYAIDGDKITGVTSSGKEISFAYTPPAE